MKLKDKMDAFNDSNLIPSILLNKSSKQGIVTMDILCNEIQIKQDLETKLNVNNQSHRELLWNIIDAQINATDHQYQMEGVTMEANEGIKDSKNKNETSHI